MTPDQISKLPPELRKAAELCEKAAPGPWGMEFSPANDGYEIAPVITDGTLDWDNEICVMADSSEDNAAFIREARTALPLALTWCLQVVEERDAREAQLSRIAETVAKLPTITGLQEGCVKDHSLIWMAIVDAQDAYKDTLKRHQREAQQHAKRAETAEATIATLTQDLSVAMETIHRMGCNTDDCAECAALSHTPEGKTK